MFYYNIYGSNKYKNFKLKDINLFVNEHYNNITFIKNFEGGVQFRKQISWLNNNDCYLILYDKKLVKILNFFTRRI